MELLPRKNELQRPSVCNVDYGLIITSMRQPDFNFLLLDKEITSILLSHIKPLICFTKLDLLEDTKEFRKIKSYYESIGIPCFTNTDLDSLKDYLKDSLVVLTGQTGAGKSTLLNKMDETLNLKTNEISLALNRGKHTTRHTEIFAISNILFCDTPGFSALDILNATSSATDLDLRLMILLIVESDKFESLAISGMLNPFSSITLSNIL